MRHEMLLVLIALALLLFPWSVEARKDSHGDAREKECAPDRYPPGDQRA